MNLGDPCHIEEYCKQKLKVQQTGERTLPKKVINYRFFFFYWFNFPCSLLEFPPEEPFPWESELIRFFAQKIEVVAIHSAKKNPSIIPFFLMFQVHRALSFQEGW
jgi:hypothetical protein